MDGHLELRGMTLAFCFQVLGVGIFGPLWQYECSPRNIRLEVCFRRVKKHILGPSLVWENMFRASNYALRVCFAHSNVHALSVL